MNLATLQLWEFAGLASTFFLEELDFIIIIFLNSYK